MTSDNDFSFGRKKGASNTGGTVMIFAENITANQKIGDVPDNYMIEIVTFVEDGGAAADIDLGTAAGLDDILAAIPVNANSNAIQTMSFNPNADLTGFEVWLSNNLAWAGVNLSCYILLRNIKQ